MKTVSIHDAKTNLSKYIAAAKTGEQIYIGSYGKAEVELVVIPAKKSGKRKLGDSKIDFHLADDAFSPETDAEIAELMLKDNLDM